MTKVIDYWHQPFTPELMKKAYVDDPEQAQVVKWWGLDVKGRTPEEFIADMDKYGIDKVLIPSGKIKSYMRQVMQWNFTTEEIYNIIKDYPTRLYGLHGINPEERMDGVRELERAVKEFGFVGAHLHTYGFGIPVNDKRYFPFYAKCVELDVPVVMQIGHSAEAMPSEMGRPILLDDIALFFPELKIVAAHTGWPWCEELIAMSWKHPNIYIGTTAHGPKYWDKNLVSYLNTRRGIGKVMFGTDYPVLNWPTCLKQIDDLGLRPEAKEQLLYGTASKVFKFSD
ncbi:amidohydrolase [Desulfallas sp. Bu1-1]|uniref:amidohydrolase family protein n=1 Tax=Desulfallas sp. Bu1-1 TaxID=2787620 RepID=UPI0018A0EBFB|nr:amidohydrolase family protein [Desulfallas sp. Bu1-1]MBF7082516.1 amidohydrolase [Desulfallas sp. Bu1-1]